MENVSLTERKPKFHYLIYLVPNGVHSYNRSFVTSEVPEIFDKKIRESPGSLLGEAKLTGLVEITERQYILSKWHSHGLWHSPKRTLDIVANFSNDYAHILCERDRTDEFE